MLRMLFVPRLFNLADEACEEALCANASVRSFMEIDVGASGCLMPPRC